MTQPLGFSLLEETNHKISNKNNRNKTIRKKRSASVNSKKVTDFLNFLNDDDGKKENFQQQKSLADYDILPNPQIPKMPIDKTDSGYPDSENKVEAFDEDEDDDMAITNEGFESLNQEQVNPSNTTSAANANYYRQHLPPQMSNMSTSANQQYMAAYNSMTNIPVMAANSDPNGLMKKLNYMIHMLEEQQDEKTENVTEELVLYLFLGVFVIFVCDSFARAGKYTR
jgi:hypothetical protein